MIEKVASILDRVRKESPLVLSLTNSVVQAFTANTLLAVGAVPAMLNDGGEAVDMLEKCANGLLINLGTLTQEQSDVMHKAVLTANRLNVPWVLDPVAVGLLSFRSEFAAQLLELRPSMIRGNASEIMALAGYESSTRGPESTNDSRDAVDAAKSLSATTGAVVLVTGETDYATDGSRVYAITNGHVMMSRVTGVGCAMGGVAAACLAVADSRLDAAVTTAVIMGICGEMAAETSLAPGSFAVGLTDALYLLSGEHVRNRAGIS